MTNLSPNDLESKWDRIRSAMERHKHRLERGGYVVRWRYRSAPVASIRFREPRESGRAVLRAIYLGSDEELVRRAQELLFTWQIKHHPGRSPVPQVRETWKMLMGHSKSLKGRHRRAFINHMKAALANPPTLWAAIRRWPVVARERHLRRRGGRPTKGRLAG
ncbi:MAG: hypothetical protein HZA51_12305 [Planctomycetes bacterium]|nr:hypothetical protein [Planctomycetota bacterium]